jgi:malate dehydrogenase (quinone)
LNSGSQGTDWQNRLKEWIPSYGESLIEDSELLKHTREKTLRVLGLNKA